MLNKTNVVGIKVSPEEREKLKQLAVEKNTTVSRMLYAVLKESGII